MESLTPSSFDGGRGGKWIAAIAILFAAINMIGLDRSPVVWIDEVAMNDPAKELVLHGRYSSSVFAGHHHFEEVYLWVPPGQPLVIAASYALAGFGIWQTRVPPVLFGAAAIVMLYLVSRRLFRGDIRPAIATAFLLLLEPQFLQTARAGRMDTQCIFFALMALHLYLRAAEGGRGNLRVHFLSGLSIGAALMTTPVAAPWALSIGLLTLFESRDRRILRALIYSMGAAIVTLPWVLYALRTPEAFHEQFFALVGDHVPALAIPHRVVEEFIRYWRVYRYAPVLILFFVASLAWMFTRFCDRTMRARLALLFSVSFLFNMFFMGKLGGYYSLHPNLILLIAGGGLLFQLWNAALRRRWRTRLGFAMLPALLLANLITAGMGGRLATLAYQWKARDYSRVTEAIRATIPKGSVVWGTEGIWYAVEECGSTLRLLGEADPRRHDFMVLRKDQNLSVPDGFRLVKESGESLPPLFGRITVNSFDYRLRIYRSALRNGSAPTIDSTRSAHPG